MFQVEGTEWKEAHKNTGEWLEVLRYMAPIQVIQESIWLSDWFISHCAF